MIKIRRFNSQDKGFTEQLQALVAWESVADKRVNDTVQEILNDVKRRGDVALIEYTNRFDRMQVTDVAQLQIPVARLQQALQNLPPEQREHLQKAADRIRSYHERQQPDSWSYTDADGTMLGQRVTPLDNVGLYVPGGKAAYPSSVLMSAIPAKVAGVQQLVLVVPTPDGQVNELVLAAAALAEVEQVFTVGGAQAIAALAYGTETVPAVAKIVGPGNVYVATAKRLVFGTVGIDMIAGPSEVLVICDGKTRPDWIAMDLFSQAEHDEDAQAILVSPDAEFLDQVQQSIDRLVVTMERGELITQSLTARGAFIQVADLDEAAQVTNTIAPEHLELSIDDPQAYLAKIRHAGAIFMGRYTAEAFGDYCAGPSHVLPTSRTARFSSPLGVYDFQKRSSLIMCSAQGASALGKTAAVLARGEGLTAHARSAEYRIEDY